jgi:hypothetical protein
MIQPAASDVVRQLQNLRICTDSHDATMANELLQKSEAKSSKARAMLRSLVAMTTGGN